MSSILNIDDTLTSGDMYNYIHGDMTNDIISFAYKTNHLDKTYCCHLASPLNRIDILKLFKSAPEGIIEYLVENKYIYQFVLENGFEWFLIKNKLISIFKSKTSKQVLKTFGYSVDSKIGF